MAYTPTFVAIAGTPNQQVNGINSMFGFAVPFRYLLMSYWVCLGNDTTSRTLSAGGGDSFFSTYNTRYSGVLLDLSSGLLPPWFQGTFGWPADGLYCNVLISVDSLAPTIQCYINDAAAPLISGGLTGGTTPPGLFQFGTTTVDWLFTGAGSQGGAAPVWPAVADFWCTAPTSFVDLSVVANRRKFINADLTAVDPGVNGSGPFGTQPQIYMTARDGIANDFAHNNGSGGPMIINNGPLALQVAGACSLPPPPPGATQLRNADLFFSNTTNFIDLSQANNRRLFATTTGIPQWLGSTATLPLNKQPAVYLQAFPGNATAFATNAHGVGGAFSVTGGSLLLDGSPGCAPYSIQIPSPQGSMPEWRLFISDDGGRTWLLTVKTRSMGKIGEYLTRVRWLKLGQSRNRMLRLECTDPVRKNIVGVYLDTSTGMT